MKMTFKVEKVTDFSMEVNSAEDFRKYQNMCDNIVDDLVKFTTPTNDTKNLKYQGTPKTSENTIQKAFESVAEKTSITKNTIAKYSYVPSDNNLTVEYKPKKLIFFKCTTCGKIDCKLIEDEITNNMEEIFCKSCLASNPFSKDKLQRGHYNCESCGTKAHFWILGDDVDVILCKECKAPLDMKFHEKQGQYLSINLC